MRIDQSAAFASTQCVRVQPRVKSLVRGCFEICRRRMRFNSDGSPRYRRCGNSKNPSRIGARKCFHLLYVTLPSAQCAKTHRAMGGLPSSGALLRAFPFTFVGCAETHPKCSKCTTNHSPPMYRLVKTESALFTPGYMLY